MEVEKLIHSLTHFSIHYLNYLIYLYEISSLLAQSLPARCAVGVKIRSLAQADCSVAETLTQASVVISSSVEYTAVIPNGCFNRLVIMKAIEIRKEETYQYHSGSAIGNGLAGRDHREQGLRTTAAVSCSPPQSDR